MTNFDKVSLGLRLQLERKNLELTQESVSLSMDIAVRTLKSWEAGDSAPNLWQLINLSKIGYNLSRIFEISKEITKEELSTLELIQTGLSRIANISASKMDMNPKDRKYIFRVAQACHGANSSFIRPSTNQPMNVQVKGLLNVIYEDDLK